MPASLLDHRVVQQRVDQHIHLIAVEIPLQEIQVGYRDGLHRIDAQRLDLTPNAFPAGIAEPRLGGDFDAVNHGVCYPAGCGSGWSGQGLAVTRGRNLDTGSALVFSRMTSPPWPSAAKT